ncbi:MAG TPA: hypothetical protein VFE51_09560, partial [Verrucomicrobiae bacterium]|nr:hypothetical protein [Verrucomicrobiae bacterium]
PALGFDMELFGSGYLLGGPMLAIAPSGDGLILSWPSAVGSRFGLYSATNLGAGANWSKVSTAPATNADQVILNQAADTSFKVFRLQQQ